MKRTLAITVGVVMVLFGAVFTFQGLGVIKGSAMTGVQMWAILGPIIAGLGVALAYVGFASTRRS
jgi:hypothetical protein